MSLVMGVLACLAMIFVQRNFKGVFGRHEHLPRPGQNEKSDNDNGKPSSSKVGNDGAAQASEEDNRDARPGYVPLTEEEVKLDSSSPTRRRPLIKIDY